MQKGRGGMGVSKHRQCCFGGKFKRRKLPAWTLFLICLEKRREKKKERRSEMVSSIKDLFK